MKNTGTPDTTDSPTRSQMLKDISIKSVPRSFTTLPAGVPTNHIRFYVLTNYFYPAAILVHLAFIALFGFLGMPLLSLYPSGPQRLVLPL